MKFEKELSNQTSFFRSFTNETAGPVNDILSTFKNILQVLEMEYLNIL